MSTVKKNVIPPPPPPRPSITYTVELTEAEVAAIRYVLGSGMMGNVCSKLGLYPLHNRLVEAMEEEPATPAYRGDVQFGNLLTLKQ
jgi:hypothetical protein